jgi:uncharacterized protein with HEPN domain
MTADRLVSDYLRDILDATEKALQFVEGIRYEEFADDEKSQFAVYHALEVIGEAARHVPADLRGKYPEVNWRAMSGMRDKLVHAYFGVNLEVVWRTVREDLPILRTQLPDILSAVQDQERP